MTKEQLDEYNAEIDKKIERLNRIERAYQLKKRDEKDNPSSPCHLCDKPDCMSCAKEFTKMANEKYRIGENGSFSAKFMNPDIPVRH
jgi:hypothetical protein